MGRCYYFFVFFSGLCWRNFWYALHDWRHERKKVSEYRFDNKQPLPGNYELDVYVNHQWRGKQDITIPESPAKPCLPKVLLTTLGVKTDNLNTEDNCILLDGSGSWWTISVGYQWTPTKFNDPTGVYQWTWKRLRSPESWDRGIDAFYTSYNLSQYRSYDSNNNSNTASYGRFNSGLNLFSWQLHSDASYSKPDDMKGTWQSNTLYGTWLVANIKHSSDRRKLHILTHIRLSAI